MYRIIIADDETIERKALRKLINTQYPQIKVVGEASNGEEAVQICDEHQPDIVIMDIKMPIINGIEAAALIKQRSESTHVIISSAYNDNNFMMGAIDLGVDKYLLKPYDAETLAIALKHTINEIIKERSNRLAKNDLNRKLNNALPLVENQFVISAINGSLSKEEIKEYYRILNKDFSSGFVLIFGLKDDQNNLQEAGERINSRLKNAYRYIHEEMNKNLSCALSIISANKIAAIISAKEIRSDLYKGINNLAFAYKRTENYLMVSDNEGFFNECRKKMHVICNIDKYPAQKEKNLSFAIKTGNKKLYQKCITELFSWFERVKGNENCFIIAKVYMNSLLLTMQKLIISKLDMTQEYEMLNIDVYQMERMEDILALKDIIDQTADEVMNVLNKSGSDKMERIIANAEKYILNFYFEEITLEDMAENALLSPQYFSKVFKEKTGETFVKYLKKVRMEKSNELLENSELPVADICYKVGYNDPDYFFKVYKNYYNVTPSEYRKKLR